MTTEVSVRGRAGQATVWLEVAYDGLAPPTGLFADLEMIGWRPPSIASPPRSAIDWTTPDPETGQRFTIRDWRVTDQVVEPPPGSGSRGTWTAADRHPFLVTLDGVLRRHGIFVLSAELGTLPPPPPAATAPAAPVTAAAEPAPEPAAGRTSTALVAEHGVVRLVAEVDAALASAAGVTLTELGITHRVAVIDVVTERTYRGSTYETRATVRCLEVCAPEAAADLVVERLLALGVMPTQDPELVAAAASGPTDEPVGPEATTDEDPSARATIVIVMDVGHRPLVDEELEELALDDVTWSRTVRPVVQRYRGSEYTTDAPALRLEVAVPPEQATPVARTLARVAGVDVDDPEACAIHRPDPGPGPRPEPAADQPYLTLVPGRTLRSA